MSEAPRNNKRALSIAGAELTWHGKYGADGRMCLPNEQSLAIPLHVTEHYHARADGDDNLFLHADNLRVMAELLKSWRGGIDLIYVDPPFCAGAPWKHDAPVGTGTQRGSPQREDVAVLSYDDRWGRGGRNYLQMVFERFVLMRELLSDTGSLYVHVDYRAHPFVRLMLEEIFGPENLVNDIVWSYRSGGGTKKRFGCKHDNILLFAKSRHYKFNPDAVRVPYDAVIPEKWRDKFHDGGKVCPDVWDISRPPNHSSEWIGYATQKPEALIERAIRASTDEGDVVADFFCGSGTTGAVAQRLRRRWLLCDESPAALHAARKRLMISGAPFQVLRAQPIHFNSDSSVTFAERAGSIELVDYSPGLHLVDYWSIDTQGTENAPFSPQWFDYRLPKKREIAFKAALPVNENSARVLVADVHGHETFVRAGEIEQI